MIEYKQGCLFEISAELDLPLMHQCNCTSNSVSGLAAEIFRRFPGADDRKCQFEPERYGTYSAYYPYGADSPPIINAYAQRNKGAPTYGYDSAENRLRRLGEIIKTLEQHAYKEIAIPYLFGCNLAGGHWPDYEKLFESSKIKFIICKK